MTVGLARSLNLQQLRVENFDWRGDCSFSRRCRLLRHLPYLSAAEKNLGLVRYCTNSLMGFADSNS
jgi:hypothetical protein